MPIEALVFVPLLYLIPPKRFLADSERDLILGFDCISPNGFNSHASMKDPRVVENMRRAQRIAQTVWSDERRSDTRARLHTDEVKAKRNAAIRNPEVQARKSVNQRKAFADPAFKAKQREIMAAIHARPDVKAKRAASVKASWEKRRSGN